MSDAKSAYKRGRSSAAPNATSGPLSSHASPAGGGESFLEYLTSLYICTICFDHVMPPIVQCMKGHFICASCRKNLRFCVICRVELGNIRNLAMEKVATVAKIKFPCKYAGYGCQATLYSTEKTKHEESCQSRTYTCPYPGCFCELQRNQEHILEHLMKEHNITTAVDGNTNRVFGVANMSRPIPTVWIIIMSCFGHHFLLSLTKQKPTAGHVRFQVSVKLIGSREHANKFNYSVRLTGSRRQLTWETRMLSIDDKKDDIFADGRTIDEAVGFCFDLNGDLAVNIDIKADSTQKTTSACSGNQSSK